MDRICPECLGVLLPAGAGKLRCSIHGGEFTVLFDREEPQLVETSPLIPAVPADPAAPSSVSPVAPPPAAMAGKRCVQHPHLDAVQQCRVCGAFMCATCDFALPNDVHVCPSCATKPQSELGPKRKRSMLWSYGCAGFATLGFILTLGVAASHPSKSNQEALGLLATVLVLVPSIVGLAMGLGAVDRRYRNPPALWIATIWNGVILGLFLLLAVVGSLQ